MFMLMERCRLTVFRGMTPDEAKATGVATYDATADFYDDPLNFFWARFGRSTIDRLVATWTTHS
jgi:hypothetical protein